MPNTFTDAAEAINRSFEMDDASPAQDASVDDAEWLDDCLNDWYNN